MIKNISISNYKSIDKLSIDLGRVNVFIGENGAGKSNILEAIALAGAASADKLDNEFLSSRGIRVTPPEYMRPAFPDHSSSISIDVEITSKNEDHLSWKLHNENTPYSKWRSDKIPAQKLQIAELEKIISKLNRLELTTKRRRPEKTKDVERIIESITNIQELIKKQGIILNKEKLIPSELKLREQVSEKTLDLLSNFIIYSPENSALKNFHKDGQIEPLGINGEGLLRLLTVLSADPSMSHTYEEIKSSLKVLGWFESFDIINDTPISRIEIQDKYIDKERKYFDQLSANEGFLFLLFYFTLFASDLTPKFFAIDNIDASLNPKLCQELMKRLTSMAAEHDKQVILTTHNPAILDGLNLDDDEQRLFVIRRNSDGHTRYERISKPESKIPNRAPKKLSELFMSGALGGLPNSF